MSEEEKPGEPVWILNHALLTLEQKMKVKEENQARESASLKRYMEQADIMKSVLLTLIHSEWGNWAKDGWYRSEHPLTFAGKCIQDELVYLAFSMKKVEDAERACREYGTVMDEATTKNLFRAFVYQSRIQQGFRLQRESTEHHVVEEENRRWMKIDVSDIARPVPQK